MKWLQYFWLESLSDKTSTTWRQVGQEEDTLIQFLWCKAEWYSPSSVVCSVFMSPFCIVSALPGSGKLSTTAHWWKPQHAELSKDTKQAHRDSDLQSPQRTFFFLFPVSIRNNMACTKNFPLKVLRFVLVHQKSTLFKRYLLHVTGGQVRLTKPGHES